MRQTNLQRGKTKSCGCLAAVVLKENLKQVENTSVTLLEYFKTHLSSRNNSGFNGVYQEKKSGKWVVQLTFQGKTKYLGSFDTLEEAVRARCVAEEGVEAFIERFYQEHPEEKRPKDRS